MNGRVHCSYLVLKGLLKKAKTVLNFVFFVNNRANVLVYLVNYWSGNSKLRSKSKSLLHTNTDRCNTLLSHASKIKSMMKFFKIWWFISWVNIKSYLDPIRTHMRTVGLWRDLPKTCHQICRTTKEHRRYSFTRSN